MLLNGHDLLQIGFPPGKALGLALSIFNTRFSDEDKSIKLDRLKTILAKPANYLKNEVYKEIAENLLLPPKGQDCIALKEAGQAFQIFGEAGIEAGAMEQMQLAMKLPVSIAGSLMPDAHQGYGLPIGGVLATENAIIPYGVGVDIGCRMCLSIFPHSESWLEQNKDLLKQSLMQNTRFGWTAFDDPWDHAVLESALFKEIKVVKNLKDRAAAQIGSSGGGNHFVEFGIVEILDAQNEWGLKRGKYLALLSHSGSRGFGAEIAKYYTKVAMENCKLPDKARHLAWLDLDSEKGQEYWLAMNLAGDYASACHEHIHQRMALTLGQEALARVENHHNFAWKEIDSLGNEVIVHRKGATPAGAGVLGIIPGSMAAPGFVVRGKGNPDSLSSASHGAGRLMSRSKAKKEISPESVQQLLSGLGIELIGADLDEAPMAYKNIHQVMAYQQDLVEVIAAFQPKIVRMCEAKKYREVD